MNSDVRICLLPISCVNVSLSFIQFLLSQTLSSDGRVNFPLKVFFGAFLYLSTNAQRFDLDLSSLLNRFSLQICTTCTTVSWMLDPATVSRGQHEKILTLWEPCLLRFACFCWMLLNAENFLDPLWWRSRWRRHGTGNFCDCQGN